MTMRFTARLRHAVRDIWDSSKQHPFLCGLRDGSLEQERFVFYMKQDYVFLKDYARLFALGSLKAADLATMEKFAALLHSTLHVEMELHRQYAERLGLTREELEAAEAAPVTLAYTRYMLDEAGRGALADVAAVLLPCMWSYRELGSSAVADQPECLRHELYKEWFLMYSSGEFGELTDWCIDLVDELAEGLPERELSRLETLFVTASKFEHLFWDMAYWRKEWLL